MTDITFKDIEAEVRKLAAERPDFEYPEGSCYYNPSTFPRKPSCLFGQAFINLGEPVPESYENIPITTVMRRLGIRFTEQEGYWAGTVQNQQDGSHPWGKAIALGDKWHPLHEETDTAA
ncbi:hypothetical protein AB0C87_24860 [Actinomadura sp. NPDC048021]|uniref:hypothetical protein n=1 Tax=Actinomadura sp. NPDC048021 TaxID=3155385 RepID=UPI0033FF6A32